MYLTNKERQPSSWMVDIMKKVEFASYDFENEKTYEVYSNSDFCFWKDENGVLYFSDNVKSEKIELGDMAAVERFLLEFAE